MSARIASLLAVVLVAGVFVACDVDQVPAGARRTPDGNGPLVVFDITRRPLPEIPQPNDIATFADPSSRTGRRINVSLVSPTRLESQARADFGTLEGWGTFAPISVAFERQEGVGENDPAINLDDVYQRTRGYDPADDPFYVVDLTTGIPVPLDIGKGNFPLAVAQRDKYWNNDPRITADSVLWETAEEGPGGGQSGYRPELDTDFDGVLDHPNVLHRVGRDAKIEEVIDWYERESDTLLLRPVVPLDEMHEYAVVLTDRLKSTLGSPVRSPFENIHHAQQRDGAERVRAIFSDAGKRNWYGDVAGTGLDHVAFVWTFTTQPVFDDMRLLRDGMHGQGPLARLATDFPAVGHAARAVGTAIDEADEPPGAVDADVRCAPVKNHPFIVRPADVKETIHEILPRALGVEGEELRRLEQSLDDIDHFVIGSFDSPYFLGDPKHENADSHFEIDFKTGAAKVTRDTVQFFLSVPKPHGDKKQPFPVTLWSHGTTLHDDEIIIRAGYFAKQGMAMMGINMPGHGLYLEPGLKTLAASLLRAKCLATWVKALTTGRHQDLDGDGTPDSGGLLWTAHVFHSRDNIRQSIVDAMQATRVLRSWDGQSTIDQDYDANGTNDLAGDFDGNGVPDVGGPNVPITTSGNSFGGVLAMIHGAVDSNVVASAPISGGGGLMDIATRSALVPDSVLEQVFTPLIVSVPATFVDDTKCKGEERSVRFVVNDLTISRNVEIACLSPAELTDGKTVVLQNLRNGEKRCARTGEAGRFRVPIPANVGDRLDVQIYDIPDAVVSYKGCDLKEEAQAHIGRRIKEFEQAIATPRPVADETKTCAAAIEASEVEEDRGCAQFRDTFFPVGSPLVSPNEGMGLYRQSPDARRIFMLSQAGVDAGDPVNFAAYYSLKRTPNVDGTPLPPRAVASFVTAGDPFVPTGTGYTFARAAGMLPFLPNYFVTTNPEWAKWATPSDLMTMLGGKTPNDVVIERSVAEGVARLDRMRAGPMCQPNYVSSPVCTSPPSKDGCDSTLFDADWLAEGKNLWDAPHPSVPLRLGRDADVTITDSDSLTRAWAPRLTSKPLGGDEGGYGGSARLMTTVEAWIEPGGQHVFVNANPCKAFDDVLYYDHLLIRFLATQGHELVFLKQPGTHHCLVREDCSFFQPAP